ncbi:MAG TPA: hypothetical protein ENN45_00860, partial [Bacteroidetes bacterium]|nr:hypothetical protein [Bacteroidota bacterium]
MLKTPSPENKNTEGKNEDADKFIFQKKQLKTMEEIFNQIELIPESELTKKYKEKEKIRNESVESKLGMESEAFGEKIGSPSLTSADFSDKYGIVFFDLTHDPSHRGGMNGCACTSQLQIVELDNLTKMFVESYNYRGMGNSPFNHRINFSEGKILEEENNKILFGIQSHELLEFYEFNAKSKNKKLVERVDLEYAKQNKEKLEKFDKAFKELDEDAIESFIEERHMFTDIKKINDDYSIAMLYDPYGDTGSRHAETKLIVKGKGIIDLKHHGKEFPGSAVTQGFDIEDIKLRYDGEKIFLDYTIAERESGHSSSGSYWKNTLGKTRHSIEFDTKKFDLPVNKDMKLDYLIEKETKNILSYGNTNKIPIMMQGFRKEEPINYAYRIDRID